MTIYSFIEPKVSEIDIGFQFDYERVLSVAKRDTEFFKSSVYEVIGGAECYIPLDERRYYKRFLGGKGNPALCANLMIFNSVAPHIDEGVPENAYFGHVFIRGTGVFRSGNTEVPFKPGTVILMNPSITHSIVSDGNGYVFTYCEERLHAIL